MQIPNGTFVVVADGRKMLFFRNEGDAEHPQLELDQKRRQEDPPNREIKTDEAGRTYASAGTPRSKMQEADFHQIEEDRFAAETAELLYRRAHEGDFNRLLVIAPPRTLGELRRHYHKEVEQRLVGEIDKDLTSHPVAEIEKIILAAD